MKHYLDYKKLFNLFFGVLLIAFFAAPVLFSYAQTVQELQERINQKDSDIAKLEEEIASYQAELSNVGKQKSSLSNVLKELDLTKKKLTADITVTQKKIDKTNFKIQSLNSDIGNKENSIANNIDSISLGIKEINEFEQYSILEIILSENDFSAVWNDIDNIVTIREKGREKILELKKIKVELEDVRKETIDAKNELTALKSKLSDQQKIVIQNTNEKNKLLKETKNNEANYQKLLKDRIAQKDAFEKELRDYEAQLQYILDPSKLPKAGVLSWPLGKIYVTQMFGKTVDSKRLYASGTHNGVDFRASVGTPVMAMADGTVFGTGNTDETCVGTSFGKWILIKYNNGLASVYGHLSLIKVPKGNNVKRGEVVGYSGNTGHTTGPHLHVSVYDSSAVNVQQRPSTTCAGRTYTMPIAPINAYLDALYYLPKLPY